MEDIQTKDLRAALIHIARILLDEEITDEVAAGLAQFAHRAAFGTAYAPKRDYEQLDELELTERSD